MAIAIDDPVAIPLAAGVGAVKELTDLNFNGPDFLAWPAGAALYEFQKEKGWCWKDESEPLWYVQAGNPCKIPP